MRVCTTIALLLTAVGCGDGNLQTFVQDAPDAAEPVDTSSGTTPDTKGDLIDADVAVAPEDAGGDATLDEPDAPAVQELCPRVKVVLEPGEVLNIRPTPSTAQAPVGTLSRGYVVATTELVQGDLVEGEDRWYGIESPRGNGYIHYGYAECTDEEVTKMPIGYYMPFACNASHRVTQGPGGGTSHTGNSLHAYDFACGLNTSVRAMMAGTVSVVWMETQPGRPCYNGGGSSCSNASNHIMLQHPNGQTTVYKHLNSSSVSVGDEVALGQEIGKSGNTGWSTGPHLHIGVCNSLTTNQFCQTVDFSFQDLGRPANVTVTSGNCP